MPSEPKIASKLWVNFVSRSRIRDLNCPTRSPRSMSRLRACWAAQAPVGFGRHPQNVDVGAGDLDHQQHVQALEQHRVDGEEVARQHALSLGGHKLPPGQIRAARRRIDARLLEHEPHSAGSHAAPKPQEFTMDAAIPPGRVVCRHPHDQVP